MIEVLISMGWSLKLPCLGGVLLVSSIDPVFTQQLLEIWPLIKETVQLVIVEELMVEQKKRCSKR